MRTRLQKISIWIISLCALLALTLFFLARKEEPERITYGMSFNAPYALELGLDPHEVLKSFIDELGVRHFRLAAHWTLIEPMRDQYDFLLMDDQLAQVRKAGAPSSSVSVVVYHDGQSAMCRCGQRKYHGRSKRKRCLNISLQLLLGTKMILQ